MKQVWQRNFFKVSHKVDGKWEGPDLDGWKMQRMIYESSK
jgi:hypothetical protein